MSANHLKLNAVNVNKTELVWTGSRHNLSLLGALDGGCGPCLYLGDDMIKTSDHVRLLGVTIVSGVGLDTCFKYLQDMFLLASSAETCSSLARQWTLSR